MVSKTSDTDAGHPDISAVMAPTSRSLSFMVFMHSTPYRRGKHRGQPDYFHFVSISSLRNVALAT